MDEIKPGMFVIAADGDGVGRLVGRSVLADDVEELHKVSNRIDAAQDYILHWCKDVGGIKISGGGDEFVAAIPSEAKEKIKELRASIEKSFGYTISVGVGRKLSEAATALLVAKLRGKDRIVYFNKHIKEDIKKAKRRVREGRASQEEYKLSEAYLEKSEVMLCAIHKKEKHRAHIHKLHKHEEGAHNSAEAKEGKLPADPDKEDNRTDDCAYCQNLDAEENADGTAGMHDCDMCREYDASQQNTGGIDTDSCPYCQESDALDSSNPDGCEMCQEYNAAQGTKDLENISGAQDHPEQDVNHICNCPNCPKNDATALGVEDQAAQRPDECPQCQEMYGDAIENEPGQTAQEDPNLQGHETAEQVLDMLDKEPGAPGPTPEEAAKKIDNTELPQGDAMRENVSVKENFGPAQKNDISDSEAAMAGEPGHDCNCPDCPGSQEAQPMPESDQPPDGDAEEPDMTSVLQSGLDDHANEQKKQQVLDMVSQTLQGFKANKASLEATKEQNQALYNSCIQMLKSMVELCKLLGLKPQMAAPSSDDEGLAEEAKKDPSLNAPKKAAPTEGAAQAPKAQSEAAQ